MEHSFVSEFIDFITSFPRAQMENLRFRRAPLGERRSQVAIALPSD
jgi:hypothetical protein